VPRWWGLSARPQQVDSEQQECRADDDPEGVCGHTARRETAGDRTDDRGRQHPADEPPVDAVRPDVRDRAGGGGEPGYGDVGSPGSCGIGGCEEEDGQADVPEDEADEPSRERNEEAPGADPQQGECVHSLEYGR